MENLNIECGDLIILSSRVECFNIEGGLYLVQGLQNGLLAVKSIKSGKSIDLLINKKYVDYVYKGNYYNVTSDIKSILMKDKYLEHWITALMNVLDINMKALPVVKDTICSMIKYGRELEAPEINEKDDSPDHMPRKVDLFKNGDFGGKGIFNFFGKEER